MLATARQFLRPFVSVPQNYTRLGLARPIIGTLATPDSLFIPKDHLGHPYCSDVVETSVRWGKVRGNALCGEISVNEQLFS